MSCWRIPGVLHNFSTKLSASSWGLIVALRMAPVVSSLGALKSPMCRTVEAQPRSILLSIIHYLTPHDAMPFTAPEVLSSLIVAVGAQRFATRNLYSFYELVVDGEKSLGECLAAKEGLVSCPLHRVENKHAVGTRRSFKKAEV